MTDLLFFVAVFSAGIAAGIQLLVAVVVVPSLHRLPPATAIRIHREMLDHAAHNAAVVPPTTLAICSTILLLLFADVSERSRIFLAVGLVGLAGVTIATAGFNAPINRVIRAWPPDAVPTGYAAIRARWDRVHVARTASGCLALAALIAALLAM